MSFYIIKKFPYSMLLTSSFDIFCITNVPYFGLHANTSFKYESIALTCFISFMFHTCYSICIHNSLHNCHKRLYFNSQYEYNMNTFKITDCKNFHGKSDLVEFNYLLYIYIYIYLSSFLVNSNRNINFFENCYLKRYSNN